MRNAIAVLVAVAALLGTACKTRTNPAAPAPEQKLQAATSPNAAAPSVENPTAAVRDDAAANAATHAKPTLATHAKATKHASKGKRSTQVAAKSGGGFEQDVGEGRAPGFKLNQTPATY